MNIFELNSIMHRSSQQSYPNITDILNNAIYETTGNTKKTYLRRLSSHTSPAPENLEKSTYMLINGGTRHRDPMKRRENKNNIQWKNTVQRTSNTSIKQPNK